MDAAVTDKVTVCVGRPQIGAAQIAAGASEIPMQMGDGFCLLWPFPH
jgi:hypothetical protein